MGFARVTHDLIERIDIGFCGGYHNIGVGALTIDYIAIFFYPHRHLALRIGAGGDRIDRIQLQFDPGSG